MVRSVTPKRILLVRDRDFFIHVFQLAQLLRERGHDVAVLNTHSAPIEPLYADLITRSRALGIDCLLVADVRPPPGVISVRLQGLAARAGIGQKQRAISRRKVQGARRQLRGREFDAVIAYDPASVYLACRLFPQQLERIIDYSIEVVQEDHPLFGDPRVRSLIEFERRTLPRLKALLIQDPFREKLLLANAGPPARRTPVVHFPVAVRGPAIRRRRGRLYDSLLGESERCRILFFGGIWSPSLLADLETVSAKLADDEVIVVHGGRGSVDVPDKVGEKFAISRRAVGFDELDAEISSADIGLALYPDSDPNSRYTAFASEKIARFLKCGLPFIAFRNEDYEFLQAETGCCILIGSLEELPAAVRRIRGDYAGFRKNAFAAFERFFDLEVAARELLRLLDAA